jgi:hypothetical protein
VDTKHHFFISCEGYAHIRQVKNPKQQLGRQLFRYYSCKNGAGQRQDPEISKGKIISIQVMAKEEESRSPSPTLFFYNLLL